MSVWSSYSLKELQPGCVLDLGCGDGGLLFESGRSIAMHLGVESDPILVGLCHEAGLNVVCCDVEKFHTFDRFDNIVLSDVLEHLECPRYLLERIKYNLTPNGVVLVYTPNVDCVFNHLYSWICGRPYAWRNPEHKQYFNPTTLRCLVESLGFKVVGVEYIGKIPYLDVYFHSPFAFLAFDFLMKFREAQVMMEVRLLEVFAVERRDLSQAFVEADTLIYESNDGGAREFYQLADGRQLVLLFRSSEGFLFTTVRRWTHAKEAYYRGQRGQPYRVIIDKGGEE